MTKSRIKRKWYMPNGWHTPRGIYRKIKEREKEIDRKYQKLAEESLVKVLEKEMFDEFVKEFVIPLKDKK